MHVLRPKAGSPGRGQQGATATHVQPWETQVPGPGTSGLLSHLYLGFPDRSFPLFPDLEQRQEGSQERPGPSFPPHQAATSHDEAYAARVTRIRSKRRRDGHSSPQGPDTAGGFPQAHPAGCLQPSDARLLHPHLTDEGRITGPTEGQGQTAGKQRSSNPLCGSRAGAKKRGGQCVPKRTEATCPHQDSSTGKAGKQPRCPATDEQINSCGASTPRKIARQ